MMKIEISDELDHSSTQEIVCPYCGYVFSDSWEELEYANSGILECPDCGKHFNCEKYVDVTYTTSRMKEDKNETL